MGKMEAKLTGRDFKPTVADYLKLLQIEKEVEEKELEGKARERLRSHGSIPTKHQPENSLQTSPSQQKFHPGVFSNCGYGSRGPSFAGSLGRVTKCA